jgi:hypothetical protein
MVMANPPNTPFEHPPLDPEHAHEESDVSVTGLAMFLIAMVVTIVVTMWVVVGMFDVLLEDAQEADPPPPPLVDLRGEPVGPKMQPEPSVDLRTFRASENAALNRWQWVDKPQGIAEIPIGDAMKLLAKDGLPKWPAAAPAAATALPTGGAK